MRPALIASLSVLALSGCAASTTATPLRVLAPGEPEPPSPIVESPVDPQRSRSFVRQQLACERGELEACVSLAEHFALGIGVVADNVHAREIARPLCDQHVRRACSVLASVDIYSTLTDTAAAARALAERECSAPHFEACVPLADARSLGLGGAIDLDHVESALRPACAAGQHVACAALALWLVERAPSSRVEAAQLARSECALGEPRACVALALVSSDNDAAIALLERGCSLGFARGCSLAAARFHDGDRVAIDRARARELFQRGCFHSIPAAGCAQWLELDLARWTPSSRSMLYERSCLYERDLAVCDRFARSMLARGADHFDSLLPLRAWLVPACDRGDPRVCATIAAIDTRVESNPFDRASVAPLRAACALDDVFACGRLADVLRRLGSSGESRQLSDGACTRGDSLSCLSLIGDGRSLVIDSNDMAATVAERRRVHQWASRGCAFGSRECCWFAVRSASSELELVAAHRASCAAGITVSCVQ